MLIGIDLDNTIINYQNSLKNIAKSRNIKIIHKFTKDYIKKKTLHWSVCLLCLSNNRTQYTNSCFSYIITILADCL